MTKVTLAELMEGYVFAVQRELEDYFLPLQEIIEEINILDEPNDTFLASADGNRIRFNKQFLTLVRKTFKDAEWFLGQPSKIDCVKELCLLIGVLPQDHFLLLTPKKVIDR